MKIFKIFSIVFLISILMTSGGFHSGMFSNVNNNTTNVQLNKKNFKVIDKVSGSSTATYILGFGGLSNKSLVERAKAKMLENANLTGSSKAIINVTIESHKTLVVPLFYQKTITVSAHVIEFTE